MFYPCRHVDQSLKTVLLTTFLDDKFVSFFFLFFRLRKFLLMIFQVNVAWCFVVRLQWYKCTLLGLDTLSAMWSKLALYLWRIQFAEFGLSLIILLRYIISLECFDIGRLEPFPIFCQFILARFSCTSRLTLRRFFLLLNLFLSLFFSSCSLNLFPLFLPTPILYLFLLDLLFLWRFSVFFAVSFSYFLWFSYFFSIFFH